MTSTAVAPPASAVLEHHRCIAVTCTACGQAFNDDFTHHFASLAHALRVVTSEDWVLTATGVLCWSCVDDLDHDQRPTQGALAVARCEYCWPPLFSDTHSPDKCCCASLPAATTHVLVPFVTFTHPGFEQHACVTIRCPECQSGVRAHDDEIGEPHYDSPTAALHAAAKTYDWLVTGTLTCCAACTSTRECAVLGHQLPDAADRLTDDGIEQRWCRHRGAVVLNPIGDRGMPWLLTLFTTVIAPGSAPLTARQTEILAHVVLAGGALSTSDVRARVNEQRCSPLVAEQVYRVLRALQDRGLVERVHVHGTNKAHWQATRASDAGGLMTFTRGKAALMLSTGALDAPPPLAHTVIGEGLHWLHTVAQPDTAIINPRLAAITINEHILRFVPIAWGGSAAIIIEVADVHWGLSGAPLNPLSLDTVAETARVIRACGDTISDICCATAPLTARLQIQQPPHPTLRAAAERYLRGCPAHHSRRCGLPAERGGRDCPWYSDAQRGITWPFTGYTHTLQPAHHAAVLAAGH